MDRGSSEASEQRAESYLNQTHKAATREMSDCGRHKAECQKPSGTITGIFYLTSKKSLFWWVADVTAGVTSSLTVSRQN